MDYQQKRQYASEQLHAVTPALYGKCYEGLVQYVAGRLKSEEDDVMEILGKLAERVCAYEYKGQLLYSSQDPFLEQWNGEDLIMCHAMSADGTDYRIVWEIDYPNAEEECDMVKDWSVFRVI